MKHSICHNIEFDIGETVYLKTDKEQKPRLVTAISLKPHSCVTYGLSNENNETYHYNFEISTERDIILLTN